MRICILICFIGLSAFGISTSAQEKLYTNLYMVQFTDKAHNTYSLSHPDQFLSARAILRRTNQAIAFAETDLPVSAFYCDSLKSLGFAVTKTSKWLNAACIKTTDTSVFAKLRNLSFIQYHKTKSSVLKSQAANRQKNEVAFAPIDAETKSYYGSSVYQIAIHNGQYLHNLGYRGQNMLIALEDAGFFNAEGMNVFDSLFSENRILMTRDFVTPSGNVFDADSHGSMVLSTMAGIKSGSLVGTAPKATYALFRTEDANTEFPVEEFNWAMGAELADSIGADVINTSLGYSTFDDATLSHTYADMNGNTTLVSQAANIAVSKGILVVVSAGNDGYGTWKYIAAPADADSVLTIGAVDTSGESAYFSSYGPSYDGRVKPDVSAVGLGSVVASPLNKVGYGNGTSFSSPIMAGLVTCLWEAFPNRTNMEIMNAVRQSSSQYTSPGNQIGYGIPNMETAYQILLGTYSQIKTTAEGYLKCYPNPFTGKIQIELPSVLTGEAIIQIRTFTGQLIYQSTKSLSSQTTMEVTGLSPIPAGAYFISIKTATSHWNIKAVKVKE